ncbi:MAG: hypothetical protein IPK31_17350 [Chitinophagaceae bacterium]|nr:hypothetical protein [Chitinophagaceae bacterium]
MQKVIFLKERGEGPEKQYDCSLFLFVCFGETLELLAEFDLVCVANYRQISSFCSLLIVYQSQLCMLGILRIAEGAT